MKKKNKKQQVTSTIVSLVSAVVAFIALSIFANGLVVVARDVGYLAWLRDILVYSLGYKLGYKLAASAVIAFIAYFAAEMIAYHRYRNARRRMAARSVRFTPPIDTDASRIA